MAESDRRIITVLFADLRGFTQLTERLDAEEVRELVVDCLDPLCDAVAAWGGFVDKLIGDCVMALFGAPVAYENEPERALRAAMDMHDALRGLTSPVLEKAAATSDYRPEVRVGIATGPVVTGLFAGGGARNYTAIGDTVNVAARLQGLCETGRILADETTCHQARHIFEFDEPRLLEVKGRKQPVKARYVRGLRERRGAFRGFEGQETRLVGRDRELASLVRRWERPSETLEVCLLGGVPGIGKSRLVAEFITRAAVPERSLACGRCYPYAAEHPWEPLDGMLRDLYGIGPEMPAREAAAEVAGRAAGDWSAQEVAALELALGGPAEPAGEPAGEAADGRQVGGDDRSARVDSVIRRALGEYPGGRSLLVLEDVHWADETTLDFLSDLFSREPEGRSLLLLVSRPPLPGEVHLKRLYQRASGALPLGPLSDDESRDLIVELLGSHALEETLLGRIVARSEGNPLFIEELVKTLIESGSLIQRKGVWETDGDPSLVGVPDSIESLLSTRVDALPPAVRQTLQYASVVGTRFWAGAVSEAMAGRPVEAELAELESAGLVHAVHGSLVPGDHEYTFDHQLQQEVVYRGLLRGLRADLHGKVAAWVTARMEGLPGQDEHLAFHYQRSTTPERALPFLESVMRDAPQPGAAGEDPVQERLS